jgi:single-strand DNA-binding protein
MNTPDEIPDDENSVQLRGRLATVAEFRDLPSGDVLATFRVTVARPPGERGRVDTLECMTTRARARKTLGRAQGGDRVEVVGTLRRRFWRTPGGVASRYAVDVRTVRVTKAGRRGAASPSRTPASA